MDQLKQKDFRRIAVRSLMVQTPLNFKSMQGPGYLFAIWPWIKNSAERKSQAKAAGGYVNSHPVFACFAMGATLKRLQNGDAEKNLNEFISWREMLGGPLGLIGDQLIWDRWKPLCFALGALLLLIFPTLEAWYWIAALCLLIYNVPLFWLRAWAVRKGYELGANFLELSSLPVLPKLRKRLTICAVGLAGLLFGAGYAQGSQGDLEAGLQFLTAFALTYIGEKLRLPIAMTALGAIFCAIGAGHLI